MKYLFIIFIHYLFLQSALATTPELMLVGTYQNQDVSGWVMSEKLDGIRGYWDGKELYTRQQRKLSPPHYFIKDFPPFAIDGELFSKRNEFEKISSIVRSQKDKGWETLALYVFDVPNAKGNLFERLAKLEEYLEKYPTPYIKIIPQIPIKDAEQVKQYLKEIEDLKGEGLILRDPKSPYEAGIRSSKILKLKTALDEECTVVAHHQGKGQFANMMGAISCENDRGRFKIGSGFNIEERSNPPAIGSTITYKYRGLTSEGKPRFATYWREKKEK